MKGEESPTSGKAGWQLEKRTRELLVWGGALFLFTLLLYLPTLDFGYFALDDYRYTTANWVVNRGINLESFKGAFRNTIEVYWLPLTWLSYAADVSLFGLSPSAFHRTNAALFGANAVLFFLLLNYSTGSRWRSLFAALLFASHPMRVESVAWISERKDVLSGLFVFASLLCHVHWVKVKSRSAWAGATAFMALGLLAKPIAVVVPLLMLSLDFWPLGRLKKTRPLDLLIEKAPALLLAALFSALTLYTQAPVLKAKKLVPVGQRLLEMGPVYLHYLKNTFWFDPVPLRDLQGYDTPSTGFALLSFALIAALFLGAWKLRKSQPVLLFGFFWFFGALFPLSGLFRSGLQVLAERFTYLAHPGLFAALAWGLYALFDRIKLRPLHARAALSALVLVSALFTASILPYWKDTSTLLHRTIALYPNAAHARVLLGVDFAEDGNHEAALRYTGEAVRIEPTNPDYVSALAHVYLDVDDYENASRYFSRALEMDPSHSDATYGMGITLLRQGNFAAALTYLEKTARTLKDDPEPFRFIAQALQGLGRPGDAALALSEAVRINPAEPKYRMQLGTIYGTIGQHSKALDEFRAALRYDPESPDILYNVAFAEENLGRLDEAARRYRELLLKAPGDMGARLQFAALLLRLGQPAEALRHMQAVLKAEPGNQRALELMAQTRN